MSESLPACVTGEGSHMSSYLGSTAYALIVLVSLMDNFPGRNSKSWSN
jgi:hypothetical protein